MSANFDEETIGKLIDVVEDWLEKYGYTADDFPDDDLDNDGCFSIITGNNYDYLADNFAAILNSEDD